SPRRAPFQQVVSIQICESKKLGFARVSREFPAIESDFHSIKRYAIRIFYLARYDTSLGHYDLGQHFRLLGRKLNQITMILGKSLFAGTRIKRQALPHWKP